MPQTSDFCQRTLAALARLDGGQPLYRRLAGALNEALEAHSGGTFAVVSHGVTLRVVLMGLLPAQAEQLRYAEIGNASITTLHHDGASWALDQLSFVGHLGEISAVRGEAATW